MQLFTRVYAILIPFLPETLCRGGLTSFSIFSSISPLLAPFSREFSATLLENAYVVVEPAYFPVFVRSSLVDLLRPLPELLLLACDLRGCAVARDHPLAGQFVLILPGRRDSNASTHRQGRRLVPEEGAEMAGASHRNQGMEPLNYLPELFNSPETSKCISM